MLPPPPCRGRCREQVAASLAEERLRSPQEERRGWRSPGGRGEGESRKRGSAEDGNVSEAPVSSILSQRMRGVLCVCGLRGAVPQWGVARKGMSKAADPCIPPG